MIGSPMIGNKRVSPVSRSSMALPPSREESVLRMALSRTTVMALLYTAMYAVICFAGEDVGRGFFTEKRKASGWAGARRGPYLLYYLQPAHSMEAAMEVRPVQASD